MYRATTPKQVFVMPFDTALIDELLITYSQDGVVILNKTLDQVEVSNNKLTVVLSQEEMNQLVDGHFVDIQIRIRSGNFVQASTIMSILVNKVLNDEVM